MKDCSPCEFYELCHTNIIEREAILGAVEGKLRGIATLSDEALTKGSDEVLEYIESIGDVGMAAYLKEDGGGNTEAYLDEHPAIAQVYIPAKNILNAEIALNKEILGAMQENCNGPYSMKRYVLFGKTVVNCTSTTDMTLWFMNRDNSSTEDK